MRISSQLTYRRHHVIRVRPLKIGNHLLAWLFARNLSRLIHGSCDIGFSGVPELGVQPDNPSLLSEQYDYIDRDSSYPWPKPESLGRTISRRLMLGIASRLCPSQDAILHGKRVGVCYSRYILSTNTPNLYPIRSASLGGDLLLDIDSTVCNIGYLPSRCEAQFLIPGDAECRAVAAKFVVDRSHDALYVHIRAGDILSLKNSLYQPLPIEMIRYAKSQFNTSLIFIGQLEDSEYSRALRLAFPDEEFFFSDRAGLDFEIIRAARRVLLSTSTFAWLAAWISENNDLILLPSLGLFNALEAPEINLIDCNDKRYQFLVP